MKQLITLAIVALTVVGMVSIVTANGGVNDSVSDNTPSGDVNGGVDNVDDSQSSVDNGSGGSKTNDNPGNQGEGNGGLVDEDPLPLPDMAPPAYYGGSKEIHIGKPQLYASVGQNKVKYLIVITHLGHTVISGQSEAASIFSEDDHAKYVYFLDGFGFNRTMKFIAGPVDFTNIADVQAHFPGVS